MTKLAVGGFGAVFALVGIVVGVYGVDLVITGGESEDWPTVEGSVKRSGIEEGTSSGTGRHATRHTVYRPAILYAYEVDGTTYSCQQIAFVTRELRDRDAARSICNKYPAGKTVTVYYDPDDPATAVLEPGRSGVTFIVAGMGGVFALVGVGMIVGSFFIKAPGTRRRVGTATAGAPDRQRTRDRSADAESDNPYRTDPQG